MRYSLVGAYEYYLGTSNYNLMEELEEAPSIHPDYLNLI
jgi:hypothetical protein